MRLKRSLPIVAVVLVVAAAVLLAVLLRKHAPPEPARLLPGADAFFYVKLKWIRAAGEIGDLPAVAHDPHYEKFIEESGFQFERDLDEAAFAVHYPAPGAPRQKDGSPASPRFSEVFVGKFDGDRLTAYFRKHAASVEKYQDIDVFSIPVEDRTVRAAILSVDSVAVSNHDDPAVIRGMIARSRKLASPFGGPALLREYYKHVPIASLAWGVARVDPRQPNALGGPLSTLSSMLTKPAVLVLSARYLRALRLRAEAFAGSEDDARDLVGKLTTFVQIFHAAESAVGPQGGDPDVKEFFESLSVEGSRNTAVLTATVPPGFVKKAFTPPPAPEPTEPPPALPPRSKAKTR
jgi:hypothetical protein